MRNLLAGICLLSFGLIAQMALAERPPNVVLLIGDDHGYPYFGFMGDQHVVTPTMDMIAEGGVAFTQAHSTASICRPSLRTLMTGLHPVQYKLQENRILEKRRKADRNYASLSKKEKGMWHEVEKAAAMREFNTLPKLLAKKGYVSWQGGKWWENSYKNGHFTHGMTKGWDMSLFGKDDFFHEMMGADGTELGRTTMKPLLDFIDSNQDKPFFVWYGPMLPHTPFDAPYEHSKYYQHKNLSESAKLYYSNITWWDHGVGRLMDHIETRGLMDNTLFIYVSDNGWEQDPKVEYAGEGVTYENNADFANGGHKGKIGMYDMSFRTPIIFYWPNRIQGTMNETSLVTSEDIVPTILNLAGVKSPKGLPGYSLKPLLEGESMEQRQSIVGYVNQRRSQTDMMGERTEGYYVRTLRWHFMWFKDTGVMELYDIQVDPRSERNLIDDYPHLVEDFKKDIKSWKKKMKMKNPINVS
jgi:uncharacterized sulfatase